MDYDEAMTIGQCLAQRRAELGIRQKDLAEALGVSQSQVSRWLSGESAPAMSRIPALARFLDMDEADVIRRAVRGAFDIDEFEVDYNAAVARMPDHVRRRVIELARPYLED